MTLLGTLISATYCLLVNDKKPKLRVISEIVYFGYSEEIRRRDWSETEGIEVSDNTVNLKRSRNMSLGR